MNQTNNSSRYIIGAIAVIIVIAGVLGFAFTRSSQNSANNTNDDGLNDVVSDIDNDGMDQDTGTDVSTTTDIIGTSTISTANKYKDGTYTATGNYRSPAGSETIDVTLAIRNDIIIDATVVGHATIDRSVDYQSRFISGYKSYVIGKNIDSINLTKVSGSSLTPKGFNAALTEIKTEAKA